MSSARGSPSSMDVEMTEACEPFGTTQHDYFDVDECKKWCRLCATAESQYFNIITGLYEPISAWKAFASCFERKVDIVRIIEEFLRVHVEKCDKLSQLICAECFQAINTMLEFRERVYKVQEMYTDLQSDEYRCTQVNMKVLYEKYNLIERDSSSALNKSDQVTPELTVKLPVEEIFVPDLSSASLISDSIGIEIKNKKDDIPYVEALLNDIEKACDPIADERQGDDPDEGDYYDGDCYDDDDDDECKDNSSKAKGKSDQHEVKKTDENKKNAPQKANMDESEEFPEQLQQQPDQDEYNYSCTKCKQKFILMKKYVAHMKKEHHEIICPHCPVSFKRAMELRQHLKTHRNEFNCPHCERTFDTEGRFARHIRCAHDGHQPFVCEVCGLRCNKKKQLSEHMLQHTDRLPFECMECGAGFKVKSCLLRHMQIHGDKHVCPVCGMQLNTRATLKAHLLVHSDKMEHKCDFCGRLFKRPNTLKNHLIAHTDLRPYSCDFCDKRFSTGSSCRFHKRTMHPDELAELEASGVKAYTKNIPTLHVLKAV